jgi:chromosome partitioning protein
VLLVDLDPQGNATMGSGSDKRELGDLLLRRAARRGAARDAVVRTDPGGFDLIPAMTT